MATDHTTWLCKNEFVLDEESNIEEKRGHRRDRMGPYISWEVALYCSHSCLEILIWKTIQG